jgi:hypothetical protein
MPDLAHEASITVHDRPSLRACKQLVLNKDPCDTQRVSPQATAETNHPVNCLHKLAGLKTKAIFGEGGKWRLKRWRDKYVAATPHEKRYGWEYEFSTESEELRSLQKEILPVNLT